MNNPNYNPRPVIQSSQRMQPQMQQRTQPQMQPQMQQMQQRMQPQNMQPQMQQRKPQQTQEFMAQQMQQRSQSQPVRLGAEDQYILYYSNYCINCKEFMNMLCKTPVYNKFTKINVSEGVVNIPPFVKSVPTIIVPNSSKPLVGEDVFKWLEEKSEQRMNSVDQSILPYHPDEMDGVLGDNYSYLDIKDTDQPMEHNFVYIKKGDQKIETPPEESFISTKPKASQDINSTNRPPFPQAPQRQMPQGIQSQGASLVSPMVPQSSGGIGGGDGKNVEDAYNELLARRKIDSSNENNTQNMQP
jgi:glutaredoxin-related protein